MCQHQPRCPSAEAPDRAAARVTVARPEQGWSLLCNGVIAFDDGGDLLPDGRQIRPVTTALAKRRTCRSVATIPPQRPRAA